MITGKNKLFNALLTITLAVILIVFISGCSTDSESDDTLVNGSIILATTTSTYDSGLLDYLHPIFTKITGIEVQVVSKGTGSALETGKRGDADVLLVHDRASELTLVEEGFFTDRYDVMYNDFIIVGPSDDPAELSQTASVIQALILIADGSFFFVSRGDDSGTHRMELNLWGRSGVEPAGLNWYNSIGQGMGDTLIFTNEIRGYAMTDRGTYVSMSDKLDLVIVLEGDPILFNQYGIIAVNPDKHPHVKYDLVLQYIEFMMSPEGQNLIQVYQVNGETLFFPGYGLE